ncbi:YSIRK-type signal peptide-containing protein [Lactobacillus crispatus]|uniref:YSIRK-type signal peptide-containing protein n=1 Tax=Lactobacillus crispatus TaxID=47770 RepID=UPI000AD9E1F0|nr:YSIRK-type signal peptide-containing protein [Lactobacillus crispatus]MDK7320576.1 YSIRK-type signal peptide-containing protein [Lactobacillus crispatus]MDK8272924.1 YSIRK-type signal peptide-containing protein [Lactobacillus crispatus]MDK8569064.1 YSIRK-type signal peptide-containing protein [Lactobacillus crispatus]
MTFNKNDFEGKQRFSIRKLNIGVCSVLLSTLLWTMNTSQTVHADTTDPVETEEVESAKKTTTDTGNDQTTTAGKNDNDTTAQKEVSGTDPLTSKNSTEQNSTKQAEDKKATSPEDTKDVSTQNNKEVSYSAYNKSGDPGQQTTFTQGTDSYQTNYIISRLQTNADGLVSGKQNATIRVTVPNGTLGAQYDADGKYYYYELNANVNVAQKVTFEFVDQYNNNAVVGQTYSQEFIPGVQTNLNFNMTIPTDPEGYGYELANGASIPGQCTLPAFTQIFLTHQFMKPVQFTLFCIFQ